jgi:hypothetical protein
VDSKDVKSQNKSEARMALHVAIFSGDMNRLRDAVEYGRKCGLSYWELQPSEEILKSHET